MPRPWLLILSTTFIAMTAYMLWPVLMASGNQDANAATRPAHIKTDQSEQIDYYLEDFLWVTASDEHLHHRSLHGARMQHRRQSPELDLFSPVFVDNTDGFWQMRATLGTLVLATGNLTLGPNVVGLRNTQRPVSLNADSMSFDAQRKITWFSGNAQAQGVGWNAAAQRMRVDANDGILEMIDDVTIHYRSIPVSEHDGGNSGRS